MYRRATPMIHVPDLRVTVEWYQSIGFRVTNTFGDDEGLSVAMMERAGARRKSRSRASAIVEHVVCVIDRQAGGAEALTAADLELRALFTKRDLDESRQ